MSSEDIPTADASDASDASLRLFRDLHGRLVLRQSGGQEHIDVRPVRCFPISRPEQWISLCDAEGHELVCVEDSAALSAGIRDLLEEELARYEFVPILERIVKISDEAEYARWEVETDRGPTSFRINSEDAVRKLDARRVMIVDACGTRYLIPNVGALDRADRRLLDHYI